MNAFLLSSLLIIAIAGASTPRGTSPPKSPKATSLTPKGTPRRLGLSSLASLFGRSSAPELSGSSRSFSLPPPLPSFTTPSAPTVEDTPSVSKLLTACSTMGASFSDVFPSESFTSFSTNDLLRCAKLAHDNYNRELAVDIVHQHARKTLLGNFVSDPTTQSISLAQEVANYGAKKGDVGLLRRLFDYGQRGRVMLSTSTLAKNALKHAANEYTRTYLASL